MAALIVRSMPHHDIESLRKEVAIAAAKVAALNVAFTAIAELRGQSDREAHRLGCAGAAGSIGACVSNAERSLQEAKRALA